MSGHVTATEPALEVPAARGGGPRPSLPPVPPRVRRALRWVVVVAAAVAIYAAFLVANGADPIVVLRAMWRSALGDANGIGETLVRATPLLLAALAVAVPARGGLFNIGGEGQLLVGAMAAVGASQVVGAGTAGVVAVLVMAGAGMVAGALWALVPALLKVGLATNEAITTLLSNYLAGLVLTWLVFGPWKDPASLGQAYSERLPDAHRLPIMWGNRVHVGIVVAAVVAGAVWLLLRKTAWGFQLRAVGGNPEAARRAGLRVGELRVQALVFGGALAGLGGMIEVAGVEARLRPDMLLGFGFIGFLVSWLGRHHPLKAIGGAVALGAIAVGGNGLKLASGLSGSAVNILMAVLLLAVLGWAPRKDA